MSTSESPAHQIAPSGAEPGTADVPLAVEVLIVGGGMVGMTLAVALADAGLPVAVIDHADPGTQVGTGFDGRVSAIAAGSGHMLETIGLWRHIRAAEPILDIRVADDDSPVFVHYDHRAIARDGHRTLSHGAPRSLFARFGHHQHYPPPQHDDSHPAEPLGHIVENRVIRQALAARAAELPNLAVLAPASLASLVNHPSHVMARLADGRHIRAALVVGAEGRTSSLRTARSIQVTRWTYPQAAIVCTIAHEDPHGGVAHERFLPIGPFAILPMTDDVRDDGTRIHRSSLVWTDKADLIPIYLALGKADFDAEIARRVGDFMGRVESVGPRWSYPLSLMHAERYVDERLALIGDAAHVIHPIAGQGLNLGLRDVAALAEVLVDARRVGLDIGFGEVLARYERWRRVDNVTLAAVTDGLNRIFSTDFAPIRLARRLGFVAVQRTPLLKRFFMRHAMGLVGELPRLVRGERL